MGYGLWVMGYHEVVRVGVRVKVRVRVWVRVRVRVTVKVMGYGLWVMGYGLWFVQEKRTQTFSLQKRLKRTQRRSCQTTTPRRLVTQ